MWSCDCAYLSAGPNKTAISRQTAANCKAYAICGRNGLVIATFVGVFGPWGYNISFIAPPRNMIGE